MELKQALGGIERFIRHLHDGMGQQPPPPKEFPSAAFSRKGLGGLALWGKEAKDYRQSLNGLWSVIAKREDVSISLREIEGLVQVAVLTALDMEGKRPEVAFEERLTGALAQLGVKLAAPPVEWEIHLKVLGIKKSHSPTFFGGVEFYFVDKAGSAKLRTRLLECYGAASQTIARVFDEHIAQVIGESSYAKLVIKAVDPDAARVLAQKQLRRCIDSINFYLDLLSGRTQIYLPGESGRQVNWWFAFTAGPPAKSPCGGSHDGPVAAYSLADIQSRAQPLGWSRISEILENKSRNDLEDRILSAVEWAGRGTVTRRKEEGFLFFAISLEELILGRKAETELTHRLATRTAHLLARDFEGRRQIQADVKSLYGIRSRIVHSGQTLVADSDLDRIRYLAKSAVVIALTQEPFSSMKSWKELDNWLEDQALMGGSMHSDLAPAGT